MSMSSVLKELKEIKNQLKPEATFIERFTRTKASVQATFDGTLKVDGQGFNLYVISTDGEIADVSYQVKNIGGAKVDEMEAEQFAYIPGPVESIDFKNDIAETGKSIFVTAYKISRLAPPMMPPSPPGTRSKIIDPEITIGQAYGIKIPYAVAIRTGGSVPKVLDGVMTGTNEHDTFQSPAGTDYSVPSGKIGIIFHGTCLTSAAAKGAGLEYADDAVDNSATGGTNAVIISQGTTWEFATANQTFVMDGYYGEIPAGKFPALLSQSTSGTMTVNAILVEVDA